MQKLRYDEKLILNVKTRIDCEVIIAPLILLTIAENAFKHCEADESGSTFIDIDLEVKANVIYYTVINSFSKDENEPKTEKIGLSNLRRQLDLIYHGKYKLDISEDNKRFRLMLILKSSECEN